MIAEVHALFRTEGPGAAAARFQAAIGGTMKPAPAIGELPPRQAEMWARLAADAPLMMEYELREFTSYLPDYAALEPVRDRLVPAAGREPRGHLPHRPAAEVAARLGLPLTEFPGAHNGIRTDADEFARQLIGVFVPEAQPAP
ncbi:hypothetical protein [Nocardia sp. BMG51109]|uniref:hypothetical protein n=1 Tax=Nocardia sp. BMG51109 TaxID=1056816 RepID=UPI0004B9E7B3|nr:hypothetical protein [Nocardia sp. BMG51109]